MFHELLAMARVEDPAKGLGKVISGVNNTRDVNQLNTSPFHPILDGKVQDINVS